MPALSLIVCLYNERDLLERMLRESGGCYDDLVVVHDGPDNANIRQLVESYGGRFFEGDRQFQQEPHLPFAFGQARHDWILHFDADEFPSNEMKAWLREFRKLPDPAQTSSGYTCFWPIWNGRRAVAKRYYGGRIFLFDRRQIKFFGMVEQAPVAEKPFEPVELVLHHQPKRKSYGFRNLVTRPRARQWQKVIAKSLLGRPTDFPCWRWTSDLWPPEWQAIRSHPIQTAFLRWPISTLRSLRSQWRLEKRFFPLEAIAGPLHHVLICFEYWKLRRRKKKKAAAE